MFTACEITKKSYVFIGSVKLELRKNFSDNSKPIMDCSGFLSSWKAVEDKPTKVVKNSTKFRSYIIVCVFLSFARGTIGALLTQRVENVVIIIFAVLDSLLQNQLRSTLSNKFLSLKQKKSYLFFLILAIEYWKEKK